MTLQFLTSVLKDDGELWGYHHLLLRPPFSVLTDLAREQLEHPSKKTSSSILACSSGALKHLHESKPAIAEESLAITNANSSEGLAVKGQMGQYPTDIFQEFSGGTPTIMIGKQRSVMGALREVTMI